MNIKSFYSEVEDFLKKSENSIFDKFKLDNSDLVNAVKNDDPDLVAKALNAWVNPNKEDGMARLALPFAIDNNNSIITGMLLLRKADPNVLGEDGKNPLTKAVYWENEDLLYLLLEAGADVNFKNNDGSTALDEARKNGYSRIEKILKGIKVAERVEQVKKDTAIHNKMKQKAQEANLLKKEKAQVASKLAAQSLADKFEAKYLSQNGTELSALVAAISAKDSDAVQYFIEKVENLNQFVEDKNPLDLAITQGNEKLALFLMKNGSDIFYENGEIVDFPMFKKAISAKQYELIQFALNDEEVAAKFLNHPKQSLSAQFLAYKDPRMFDLLLNAGADPFFGGKDGINPIKKAIEKGSIATLPVLVKNKVNLKKTENDESLLTWAISNARLDWINGLVAEGVLKQMNEDQRKGLMEIAETTGENKNEIIKLLNEG